MSSVKAVRPTFLSIEADDPIDARLEARAAEKGIPTLSKTVAPTAAPLPERGSPEPATVVDQMQAPFRSVQGSVAIQKRSLAIQQRRMRPLKILLPDYAWVALKKRSAEKMVTMRHFVTEALRAQGIHIDEADMNEDGRRLRD
jgi:hypothetical protein